MSKSNKTKKVSDAQVAEILGASHFKANPYDSAGMNTDPVQPTQMVITIDDIEEYDNNPRRVRNASYDEIKKGLRKTGAETVVMKMTRRPGDKKYMTYFGSNTTLFILKELYQETGDKKYYQLSAKFYPYTNETTIQINHLMENDYSADLVFINKAQGIRELRKLVEEESERDFSQRQFLEYIESFGYKINRTSLINYNYAVDFLYGVIPSALNSGLGNNKAAQLKNIETKYSDYWSAHDQDKEVFIVHWKQVLSDNDSPDSFSIDMVENDIAGIVMTRITEILPEYPSLITLDMIKLEVDQYQKNPDHVATLSKEENYGWGMDDDKSVLWSGLEENAEADNDDEPSHVDGDISISDTHLPGTELSNPLLGRHESSPPGTDTSDRTLQDLQQECMKYARRLAKCYGFKELVFPLDRGYGYYCEIPDAPFHPNDDIKAYFWWQLFLVATIHSFDNYKLLPDASRYRQLAQNIFDQNPPVIDEDSVRNVLTQIESSIIAFVPTTEQLIVLPSLFEPDGVSDKAFKSYVSLYSNRRAISQRFTHGELWGEHDERTAWRWR